MKEVGVDLAVLLLCLMRVLIMILLRSKQKIYSEGSYNSYALVYFQSVTTGPCTR